MNKTSTIKTSMDDEYPEITQADMDRAVLRKNFVPMEKKERVTLMLDAEIIEYFKNKSGEENYRAFINAFLKKAMKTNLV